MRHKLILLFIFISLNSLAWGDYDKSGWHKITGVNKETGTIYDAEGYDKEGFDKHNWHKLGIHRYTKTRFDEKGYDKDGYDKKGYDKNGYNQKGWNKDGWNKEAINRNTGTKYNLEGYDISGYNKEGWNKENRSKDGINKFTNTIFNEFGYDEKGYDKLGYNREGYNREGFDKGGYNEKGYDIAGYNKEGWNIEALNKKTGTKYDENGFDYNGNDLSGYDRNGWNKDGFNKTTGIKYDEKGYDRDGFNKYGINRETNSFYDLEGLDMNGYDSYGYYKKLYNSESVLRSEVKLARKNIFEDIFFYNYVKNLEQAIENLKNENLNEEEKKYLSVAIERKELATKEIIKTTKQIEKDYDEFKKISWYSTKYNLENYYDNYPGVYIGESSKEKWVIFNFTYYEKDWLFIRKILIKNDTDMIELLPLNNNVVREVLYGGKIKEIFESDVTKYLVRLKKIVNSSSFKIRLEGDNYHEDFDFSGNEIIRENINSIIDKYNTLAKK